MSISALNTGLAAMRAYQSDLDESASRIARAGNTEAPTQNAPSSVVTLSAGSAGSSTFESDLTRGVVDQIQAKNGFALAAKVVQSADEMLDALVKIKD